MIGCILTGHGSFAPGMMGAVEMIAGPQLDFEVVPFEESASLETFETQMKEAIEKLLDKTEGVAIFSDLMGGTPFRTAMLQAADKDKVAVIAGVNLPTIIEGSGLRHSYENVDEFVDLIVSIGKDGLLHAKLETHEEDLDDGDGI